MTDKPSQPAAESMQGDRKALSPAARRALDEAEARRRAQAATNRPRPKEVNGPRGPDPTRYGDWEKRGIASDF